MAASISSFSAPETEHSAGSPARLSSPNPLPPKDIPWGYGETLVCGMAVDPEQLFIYWEVTDDSIAKAGGDVQQPHLALRVFDTTHRLFDGTNAHGYFDIPIGRSDRQWFCHIGKPTSSAHIELGIYTSDGFRALCRSQRVEFPRRLAAHPGHVEWMRVTAAGEASHSYAGGPGSAGASASPADGPGGGPSVSEGGGAAGTGADGLPRGALWMRETFSTEGVTEWSSTVEQQHGEWLYSTYSQSELTSEWQSVEVHSAWEAGPYSVPIEVPETSVVRFEGPTQVTHVQGKTRVLHGPWQVVIRGLNAHWSRQVRARWEVYRSFQQETVVPGPSAAPKGSSERLYAGSSDLRLRGSSEVYYAGASELRLAGASERLLWGQSELRMRGASERRFAGASEWRLQGERALRGAGSEQRLGGASERLIRGGSERRFAGASERHASTEPKREDLGSYPPLPSTPIQGSGSR